MGPKIAIGVLVLLLVLFIVVFRHGATRSGPDERPPSDPAERKKQAAKPPEPWTAKLGELVAPFSPKLKLDRSTFTFGAVPETIPVPAATEKFRNATFRVTAGCRNVSPPDPTRKSPANPNADCRAVSIDYSSKDGKGHDIGLDAQHWQGKDDDRTVGSLVILETGGFLSFRCAPPVRCTVVLE